MNKTVIALASTAATAGLVALGTIAIAKKRKPEEPNWDRVLQDAPALSIKGEAYVKDEEGFWKPVPKPVIILIEAEATDDAGEAEEEPLTGELDDDGSIASITVGKGVEDALEPFSDAYNAAVTKQYETAQENANAGILITGSTYGLGTKGVEQEDGSFLFVGDDLKKLYKKVQDKQAAGK